MKVEGELVRMEVEGGLVKMEVEGGLVRMEVVEDGGGRWVGDGVVSEKVINHVTSM